MSYIPVTVYTTPACVQCHQTKRMFDRLDVGYDAIDLSQHPELLEEFRELGMTQAPIVVVGSGADTTRWSGFRLEKIKKVAGEVAKRKQQEV